VANLHGKFEDSVSNCSRDTEGPKISKAGHVTPTRLDLIFHFFISAPLFNLHAKFEISGSNSSRDMEAVPKYQK